MMKAKVISALEAIRQGHKEKKLAPCDVVIAAKSKSSPLHSYFVWDDGAAAHQYRLHQARHLIAEVEIVSDSPRETSFKYVSLSQDRKAGGGYREVSDVLRNEGLRADMLATALAELESFKFRYERLKELDRVFREVDRVKKTKAKS